MSTTSYHLAHEQNWRVIVPSDLEDPTSNFIFQKIKRDNEMGGGYEVWNEFNKKMRNGNSFTIYLFGITEKFYCYVEHENNTSKTRIRIFRFDKDKVGPRELGIFSPEKIMNYIYSKTTIFQENVTREIQNHNFSIY